MPGARKPRYCDDGCFSMPPPLPRGCHGDLHQDLAPPPLVEPNVVALHHRRPLVLRVRVADEPLVDRVHGALEGAKREETHLLRALPGDPLTVSVHHELLSHLASV